MRSVPDRPRIQPHRDGVDRALYLVGSAVVCLLLFATAIGGLLLLGPVGWIALLAYPPCQYLMLRKDH